MCDYRIAGYCLAGIMFGLLENERKLQLADINLAVTGSQVQSPCLLWESMQLAQYWWI